ncbi:amidohydrolase family protein [Ramlibacter albus]|uniref:Amidohydrolase family protein n=1 Tax=Ramlibacter albus TaxID=2079448 RepID=A0A923S289_9BURK|nr:amidohydrolase family protein [Ramlibacter albus]MBC5765229.1 amidohydrolase family protein [Ramlibacter albus]
MTDKPLRLPIKLDSTSNGEFAPVPLAAVERQANEAAWALTADAAKRSGMKRRGYLASVCGAAATLFAFDEVFAKAGRTGGRYDIHPEARYDEQLAQAQVGGDEFIFDVQLHHVNPVGAWRQRPGNNARGFELMPYARCGESDPLACLSGQRLLKDVFLDSDTSMAVLSHVPATEPLSPLTHEEALATKRIIDAMDGTERLLLHAPVNPREPGSLERMQKYAESVKLAAFKTYTQFDPDPAGPGGYWLDDEQFGLPMIEQARKLGVRNICIHKGIPLSARGVQFSGCRDVGVVAKRYPDMNFIIYHSGLQPGRGERAFDAQRPSGIDDLVMSLQANGIAPNANVYAELGTSWRLMMRNPEQGAHFLGKLLKHVGENNVLWGTDSIWYGSPQDQIQAFRAFQIAPQLQEQQGYPALTPQLKRKVFGSNGARVYGLDEKALRPKLDKDRVRKARMDYLPNATPDFATHGPRTRREFLVFKQTEQALS